MTVTRFIDELGHAMLKLTGYVMLFAPVGVFGAIAAAITTQGIGILATYGKFIGTFYASLAVLWVVLIAAGFFFLRGRVFTLISMLREPMMIAFTTASSEAAYPKLMERLERFGANERVTALVLPLGYSFNLDGSMIYQAFAAIFIAQAYGIEMSVGQQVTMLLVMMLSSKGVAGVPRASLVVVAAVLPTFGLPEAGLLLIMGIDQFLDMGRTATNVIGNGIATAVVAKWEGELGPTSTDPRPRRRRLPEPPHEDRALRAAGAARRACERAGHGCRRAAALDRCAWPGAWPISNRPGACSSATGASAIPFSYVGAGGEAGGLFARPLRRDRGRHRRGTGRPAARRSTMFRSRRRTASSGSNRARWISNAARPPTRPTAGKRVAFSPVIFVTGTRLAVRRGSPVRDFADLRRRPVAVVRGTTNESAMREIDRLHQLEIEFVAADDYREALSLLESGRADALAADDVLLRGRARGNGQEHGLSPGRRPVLVRALRHHVCAQRSRARGVVERALRDLAASREIEGIYNRWFVRPLPSGGRHRPADERAAAALARTHRAAAGLNWARPVLRPALRAQNITRARASPVTTVTEVATSPGIMNEWLSTYLPIFVVPDRSKLIAAISEP